MTDSTTDLLTSKELVCCVVSEFSLHVVGFPLVAGVLSVPLLCDCDASSHFKPPLLSQARRETDTEEGKEEEEEEKEEVLSAEEQRPSTLMLPHLRHGLIFALAANPNRPHPDPAAPTPNRRWT